MVSSRILTKDNSRATILTWCKSKNVPSYLIISLETYFRQRCSQNLKNRVQSQQRGSFLLSDLNFHDVLIITFFLANNQTKKNNTIKSSFKYRNIIFSIEFKNITLITERSKMIKREKKKCKKDNDK